MADSEERALIGVAVDARATPGHRAAAILALGERGFTTSSPILLALGAKSDESPEILKAAGRALAFLTTWGLEVSEFDLRDLLAEAYEALCTPEE